MMTSPGQAFGLNDRFPGLLKTKQQALATTIRIELSKVQAIHSVAYPMFPNERSGDYVLNKQQKEKWERCLEAVIEMVFY
jgi:hypothetical protein